MPPLYSGRYIDSDNLADAMGTEVYLRCFDRNKDGVADVAILKRGIDGAENRIDIMLRASHGTPFTGTPPKGVVEVALALAPYESLKFSPGAAKLDNAPYKAMWDAACKDLAMLASDNKARLETGPGEPTKSLKVQTVVRSTTPFFKPPGSGCSGGF